MPLTLSAHRSLSSCNWPPVTQFSIKTTLCANYETPMRDNEMRPDITRHNRSFHENGQRPKRNTIITIITFLCNKRVNEKPIKIYWRGQCTNRRYKVKICVTPSRWHFAFYESEKKKRSRLLIERNPLHFECNWQLSKVNIAASISNFQFWIATRPVLIDCCHHSSLTSH